MMAWNLQTLAEVSGGTLVGEDCAFDSVSTDTRTLRPGALFVALSGPSFDGHDFVAQALAGGAVAALVSRPLEVAVPQVVVTDPLAALSAFASAWRNQFDIPVLAVTGSNGKTTTKEMLGAILGGVGPTLVTQGNLNNHIGVPLTLLQLTAGHRYAVIEMGASGPGEIAHLAALANPTLGIVTNAGAAHLEGFGSLAGVAEGKGELFLALPAQGVAVINADDRFAEFWLQRCTTEKVLTFGFEQPADFMAHRVRVQASEQGFRIQFDLVTPQGTREAVLPLGGLHNLRNALGAAAMASAAGASLDQIVTGLAGMQAVGGRLHLRSAVAGAHLIDDAYNANPSSLKAGIDALRSLPGEHWLVLGEMRELGGNSDELHAEVGRYAREAGIKRLLAVGPGAMHAVQAFGSGGQWFAGLPALIEAARADLTEGTIVLIKGSRANQLERAVAALAGQGPATDSTQPH